MLYELDNFIVIETIKDFIKTKAGKIKITGFGFLQLKFASASKELVSIFIIKSCFKLLYLKIKLKIHQIEEVFSYLLK